MTIAPDSPTIGAWRRARGITGWSEEAQHLFAVAFVTEAQRRILLERLDSISRFLVAGATPDQAMDRVAALIAEYHGHRYEELAA